ncbi:LpqB family beta-propeller domain-containing protein [Microbacterium sp. KSW2-29]|uniref:LpqB family beta-propeller domain-containing protein n=1 Tax=Microbacterium phycohabitans TaxID=3075993 RepID=A0ABU3SHX5_9MICO|nr:LpqB family beta-propeller domain-containing protein [Microbacterium sp. KSW2-29]MDU0344387.1 LpqB family beta-propeller domain-containing protein [Microbacterium sp. KSW2-29]
MRRALSLLSLMLVLALTACTGLPTSGYVNPGRGPQVDDTQAFAFVPDGPQEDATPAEIVEGFLRAGSGPADDWATAKLFLAPGAQWDPRSRVTIDRLADRRATPSADGTSVAVALTTIAAVDADGAYSPTAAGSAETLSYTLARVDDQWRITSAPDGVVLYEEVFPTVYQSASVAYFDPSYSFIVPDVRWFPRPLVASRIATALVDGQPSAWLAGAVRSAFPDELSLVGRSVTLSSDGIAQVQLPRAALSLDRTTLDRMQTQLVRSLATAGINEVQMTVEGTPIAASEVSVRVTRVDPSPAVLTSIGAFGVLAGDAVEPIDGLSDAVESLNPSAVELEADRSLAAVRTQQGTVASALSDGRTFLLDDRAGLIAPSIDGQGEIWSVPANAPTQVRAITAEGVPRAVGNAWPDASEIVSMQVSRDGTRIAAIVTVSGVREVWVAGIERENTEVNLGPPHVLSFSQQGAFDLAWLDDTTVGVLVSADGVDRLRELNVGGRGTEATAPDGARTLAAGSTSVRVLDDQGRLYSRRGSSWTLVASGIRVLAAQQGTTS